LTAALRGSGFLSVRAKRSLGQNFLVDPNHQRRIVEALAPLPDDEVLEIGPGRGALTHHLVGRSRRLVLVELDDALVEDLRARWGDRPGVEIVHGDALELDLSALLERPAAAKVVGNIPYNITSPLLFKLLRRPRPESILVMVQREVADRLVARPGSRVYGLPSVIVVLHGTPRIEFDVPPTVFIPRPRVMSTVLSIDRVRAPAAAERAIALAAAAFGQRRKMVRRSLAETLPDAEASLEKAGIDPTARAEDLGAADYLALAEAAP
jgi:16S rRNA (adenine1518-N6/adenine1519-N6)-dimethyltransferase